MPDYKKLATKFKTLFQNHNIIDGTWIEVKFKGKRIKLEYGVLNEEYQTIRVAKDDRLAMVRYDNDEYRRKDKFNRKGELVKMEQTKNRRPHGSQIRKRGNGNDWIHKVPETKFSEKLDDLTTSTNYVIIIGPDKPGSHNDITSIYAQFGRELLDDEGGKSRLHVKFEKKGDLIVVSEGRRGKKEKEYVIEDL